MHPATGSCRDLTLLQSASDSGADGEAGPAFPLTQPQTVRGSIDEENRSNRCGCDCVPRSPSTSACAHKRLVPSPRSGLLSWPTIFHCELFQMATVDMHSSGTKTRSSLRRRCADMAADRGTRLSCHFSSTQNMRLKRKLRATVSTRKPMLIARRAQKCQRTWPLELPPLQLPKTRTVACRRVWIPR